MRHRVKTKKLSRNKANREALLRSLMRALILSQSIITTSAKAKEVKKFAERLISVAKKSSVNSHRRVFQRLGEKKVVKKFFSEIVPQLEDKTGGNIRLIKTGKRKGDGADMSLIEFILVEKKEEKRGKKKGKMPRIRRKKPPKEKKKEEKTRKSEKK
ncbi:50S ribosomal protein L17 [candidate division WOR-3 bacterium]|nr:50S ribosomal protein L17 [candidate division WOR-3 bacterium]